MPMRRRLLAPALLPLLAVALSWSPAALAEPPISVDPTAFWMGAALAIASFTHWLWFPPLAALPIALITPGLRPITDPPSRRWTDVLACMALGFVGFIPAECLFVGLLTEDPDLLAIVMAPWSITIVRDPGAFVWALCLTLAVFVLFQAAVGHRMRKSRVR